MRSLSIPDSTRPVRRDVGGCADIPAKLTLQGRQKILDVILCFHPLKEWQRDGEWDKGGTEKQVQGMQDPDCAEPGTDFFSSLWSIHGWTLWHLICRADETLPCLNWSGFVSSLLSHDPLLYGSVRGGGNPLEYTALVGLLFASCRPTERMLDWSYFMLGLTLSSTRLHHISCSLLFLPPFFFALPYRPPNPTILKTPHAARREEGICYSVKLLWFFMEVLQLKWYTFPCGA